MARDAHVEGRARRCCAPSPAASASASSPGTAKLFVAIERFAPWILRAGTARNGRHPPERQHPQVGVIASARSTP